jgi:hypothetical protein
MIWWSSEFGDAVTFSTAYVALAWLFVALCVRSQAQLMSGCRAKARSLQNIGNVFEGQGTGGVGTAAAASASVARERFTLRDGTAVRLRLKENISSANASVGEFVGFEVLDEIEVNGVVVIPRGGRARGSVTEAVSKGKMGRAGKLEIVLDYVRLADFETAAVRAVETAGGDGRSGSGKPVGIVANGWLYWPSAPFVLFTHGKDITIPKGAEVTAYVDGDVNLNAAKFARKMAD